MSRSSQSRGPHSKPAPTGTGTADHDADLAAGLLAGGPAG
jgi:hypothetical protein